MRTPLAILKARLGKFQGVEHFLSSLWKHWGVDVAIWGGIFAALLWFFVWPPPPGMAAMVCGGFVSLIVLREISALQKFLCVFLVTAFVVIEVRSIAHENALQEANQSKIEQKREVEFEQTVNEVTGGNAYPCIVPQVQDIPHFKSHSGNQEIPLRVWNNGKYPLAGVSISLVDVDHLDVNLVPSQYRGPSDTVQEMAPGGFARLKTLVSFDTTNAGIQQYYFNITCGNGSYVEYLLLRKDNGGAVQYNISIDKTAGFDPSLPDPPQSVRLKDFDQWPDEQKLPTRIPNKP
jgi:hypothetical protein